MYRRTSLNPSTPPLLLDRISQLSLTHNIRAYRATTDHTMRPRTRAHNFDPILIPDTPPTTPEEYFHPAPPRNNVPRPRVLPTPSAAVTHLPSTQISDSVIILAVLFGLSIGFIIVCASLSKFLGVLTQHSIILNW
jgi:hypothetical protein